MTDSHEKTLNERLAWLAGIVDGEGYIYAFLHTVRTKQQKAPKKYLAFGVAIAMTDATTIQECSDIAESLGMPVKKKCYPRSSARWKPVWRLVICGAPRTDRFLRTILPWMVTKRSQAETILAVIEHRRKTFKKGMWKNITPVTEDQWIRDQLATLRVRPTLVAGEAHQNGA